MCGKHKGASASPVEATEHRKGLVVTGQQNNLSLAHMLHVLHAGQRGRFNAQERLGAKRPPQGIRRSRWPRQYSRLPVPSCSPAMARTLGGGQVAQTHRHALPY